MSIQDIRNVAYDISTSKADLPEVIRLRALYASIDQPSAERPFLVTNYATDLGVRKRNDASIQLHEALKFLNMSDALMPHIDGSDVYRDWKASDKSHLSLRCILDLLINYAGLWETAHQIAVSAMADGFSSSDYALMTYLANSLACADDAQSGVLYSHMLSCDEFSVVEKLMTRIRWAAYTIKRSRSFSTARELLNKNVECIQEAVKNRAVTPDDGLALLGVSHNLMALLELALGDSRLAEETVKLACEELSSADSLVAVARDEKNRYFEQATINRIQMRVVADDYTVAYMEIGRHVDWVNKHDSDYLGEALAAKGYIEYLMGDYSQSCRTCLTAHDLHVENGSVTALAAVRTVLAVDYHRLGDDSRSKEFLLSMENDPAGLAYWSRRRA